MGGLRDYWYRSITRSDIDKLSGIWYTLTHGRPLSDSISTVIRSNVFVFSVCKRWNNSGTVSLLKKKSMLMVRSTAHRRVLYNRKNCPSPSTFLSAGYPSRSHSGETLKVRYNLLVILAIIRGIPETTKPRHVRRCLGPVQHRQHLLPPPVALEQWMGFIDGLARIGTRGHEPHGLADGVVRNERPGGGFGNVFE